MENNARFDRLMARVDAWAKDNAGWDCRMDAAAEVAALLSKAKYADWDDDRIVESACAAWLEAE